MSDHTRSARIGDCRGDVLACVTRRRSLWTYLACGGKRERERGRLAGTRAIRSDGGLLPVLNAVREKREKVTNRLIQ